ncbi:MAG: dTDP-4-dehydrorhamnose 3,5-epimerase [Planctomycetota bacterium]
MKFSATTLPGVLLIEPDVYRDPRGLFLETYQARKYFAQGRIPDTFVQDNHSVSRKDTLRGLHVQPTVPQGKLVRVVEGRVFDVAVDVRVGSPWFGRWTGVELSADNFRQLWVPQGFAHAFVVLSARAQFEYKCTDYYAPKDQLTIAWNDPDIGIAWPTEMGAPALAFKDDPEQDGGTMTLAQAREAGRLPVFAG